MKSKILVVDDEAPIRELVRFYIEKEGYIMIEAANGIEALNLFENEYCVILPIRYYKEDIPQKQGQFS